MPNTICRDLPYQTTIGIDVFIQKAPVRQVGGINISSHSLPDYSVTLGGAVVVGDEQISVTLSTPPAGITTVYLDAGTLLEFPGSVAGSIVRVKTSEAKIISTTAVTIATLPISAPIASAVVAKTKALLFLPGCRSAIPTPTIKTEDTTNYGSGVGIEMVTVGNSKKISMELDLIYDSIAHDLILEMLYAKEAIGREAYLDVIMPSGERHEGYCLLTTGTPTAAVQAKRSVTLEWQVQGECYEYTKAKVTPIVAGNITA
jgi:hypothetical protein